MPEKNGKCELSIEQYCYLAEMMAQGIMYLDKTGKIIWANPAAEEIFGQPDGRLIGRSPLDHDWKSIYPNGESMAGESSPSIITLKTGAQIKGMIAGMYNVKEKQYRWVKLSTFPLFRPDEEEPYQACSTFEDITEEIELKKKLEIVYNRELEFSRLLQRALLPDKLSAGEGYELQSTYLPAFKKREIGGDIYDSFLTSNGEISILIGDASGKGIEAAFLASSTRSIIRAFCFETSSAAQSMRRANEVLYAHQTQRDDYGAFTTVFLMILDPLTGRIRYANAGHPPTIVRRTNGRIEYLKATGIPVCIETGYNYDEEKNYLDFGDKILMYTDGLTDARHGKHFMGEESVTKLFQKYGHLTPKEIVEKLMEAVTRLTKGSRSDDIAIIVLERLANQTIGSQV